MKIITNQLTWPMLMLVCTSWVLQSCQKEAGFGGDASLEGSVKVYVVNGQFTDTLASYPGKDIYVYIKYGEHSGFDKRIKTDYNGNYLFDHLYPGDYEVYTYSADPVSPDGLRAVVLNTTIEKRDENITLDTLEILQ